MAARSSSLYQSALLRASREASNASTIPICPRAICSVSDANPDRATRPEPLTPRSASITTIAGRGQPSATARSTRSYWRRVDSRLCSTCSNVDCRT